MTTSLLQSDTLASNTGADGRRASTESADMSRIYLQALEEVPLLVASIAEANLPPSVQIGIGKFCAEEGVRSILELLDDDHWEQLALTAELKMLERERLHKALESHQGVNGRKCSAFWHKQIGGRPKRLLLVRHGESEANVDRDITKYVPDQRIHLTAKGRQQAVQAGKQIREMIQDETVKFIVSPYVRTKETYNGIAQAFPDQKLMVREDVRIREMEYGNYDAEDMPELQMEKKDFGAFFYRFPEGESPADVYDRASIFLETLYRSWEDNHSENLVIVSHGVMILVLLMRLFKMPIDDYSSFDSLKNGEIICLQRPAHDPKFEIEYLWAPFEEKKYGGLRRKSMKGYEIWDGNPDAPLLQSVKEPPAVVSRRRQSLMG